MSYLVEIAKETARRKIMLHFLLSFTANLVTLPSMDVFLSMALMTPVAAICLMSCTTKWPEEEGRMRHRREDSLSSVRGPFLPRAQQPSSVPGSPRAGYSGKVSTRMALLGTIRTVAALPDIRALLGRPPPCCQSTSRFFPSLRHTCTRCAAVSTGE